MLHHAFKLDITILFDTGSDNTRLLIVIHIANNNGQKLCTALLSLPAFTRRENETNKTGSEDCEISRCKLSGVWHISVDTVTDLKEFTCAIYGKSRHKSVDDLRYSILKQKCINLERNNLEISPYSSAIYPSSNNLLMVTDGLKTMGNVCPSGVKAGPCTEFCEGGSTFGLLGYFRNKLIGHPVKYRLNNDIWRWANGKRRGHAPWNFLFFSCKLVQYGGFWRMLLGSIFSFVVTGAVVRPSRTPPPPKWRACKVQLSQ